MTLDPGPYDLSPLWAWLGGVGHQLIGLLAVPGVLLLNDLQLSIDYYNCLVAQHGLLFSLLVFDVCLLVCCIVFFCCLLLAVLCVLGLLCVCDLFKPFDYPGGRGPNGGY